MEESLSWWNIWRVEICIFNLKKKGGNLKEFIKSRKEMNQEITDHEKSVILK